MKSSTIVSLTFIAIMSIMITISTVAPVVEANNNSKPKPPKCKTACTKKYDPRCAKLECGEYRTFGNQCMYEAYVCEHPNEKVKLISKTACSEKATTTPPPTCAKACMQIYDPVCAKFEDGRTETFGNQCELDNAMCGRPKEKVDVTKGECPKS
ncbi:hypothetical protein BG015_005246 [Linnemannia schmuckeri]|uniref:Kazal-like domain-containing protein n=1 Tax=Linnemannia schmuckeri TaxID=64567 RepID=A0A9P5VCN5_9FUNG|nr:hypothetical protein BG015_005246 [Linnemannia schmuckeri]